MPLLRLPTETLRQIFDQLDSSFFHEDIGRLTVCKEWFGFALPACFKSITLSQEALRNLIISTATKTASPLESSLETLDLDLRGYQYDTSPPQESDLQPATPGFRRNLLETWKKTLNDDLAQFAIIVQQSHRLRTLRVRAWRSTHPFSTPEGYLSLSTVQALLSVQNLSVLVLDLSGTSLEQGEERHICPSIAALLPTLRTLHLWMRTSHSQQCGSQGGGWTQLKADIREQAEALVTRMASPKTIRILTQTLPRFDTRSLDVLTGKTMKLDGNAAWDDDGETTQEDSEPEFDILDEQFGGFLDD
ncbi:hypothetical protein FOC4_g10012215 [Fusarium odoratissimum]|uniref:F-box domain-containing protein n=1 Tax=Fusarium oxysporum f. sp. cubense (strain race 4) TaxID=2502994 RepID=N1RA12_FUSC4|nr:hypothetical protein FOC4_g10012215 [Fusarium odoratissimum]